MSFSDEISNLRDSSNFGEKTEKKWKGFCLGYLGQGLASSLKLMVWGQYNGMGILAFAEGSMDSQKKISV